MSVIIMKLTSSSNLGFEVFPYGRGDFSDCSPLGWFEIPPLEFFDKISES